jgi:hypothetical protein
MADAFEFISPTDQPALLGLSTPEWMARARAALTDLNYKVHVAANHEDFIERFNRVHYQVVLIEELFACSTYAENRSVYELQRMSMVQRRHSAIILLGDSFQSLNAMQAFQQSVQVVVNGAEIGSIKPIIQKTVADNDLFLQGLRDTLLQITTWGK